MHNNEAIAENVQVVRFGCKYSGAKENGPAQALKSQSLHFPSMCYILCICEVLSLHVTIKMVNGHSVV